MSDPALVFCSSFLGPVLASRIPSSFSLRVESGSGFWVSDLDLVFSQVSDLDPVLFL